MAGFTHFDKEGKARMVDVSDKAETERTATAKGSVLMQPATVPAAAWRGGEDTPAVPARSARRA